MSHYIDDLIEEIEALEGYKHMYQKLSEQNESYRAILEDVINNAPLSKLDRALLKRAVKEVEESE